MERNGQQKVITERRLQCFGGLSNYQFMPDSYVKMCQPIEMHYLELSDLLLAAVVASWSV